LTVQRPVWLEEEERRSRLLQEERAEEEERARRLQREAEVNEMRRRLQSLEEENLRLKMERENLRQSIAQQKGSSYGTPEDKDAEVFPKEAETTKEEAQTPKGGSGEAEDQKEENRGSAGAQLPMNEERKLQATMMQSMVKLMEGMQTMQAQILDVRRQKDVEVVKNAAVELPKLQEWKADTAPLDLADWLLVVEPVLSTGLSEKGAILTALDSPEEASSLAGAVTGLRRWLRWHRRAGEVGVTRPDATLQIKGLGRLMKHADLAFRVQLSRSSLQVDTAPTEASVMTFANHLLAEVEQIAHQDKRRREDAKGSTEPKAKRLEEVSGGSKGEGKAWKGEVGSFRLHVSFFSQRRAVRRASNAHGAMSWKETEGEPLRDQGEKGQKGGEGKGFHKPSGKALKKGESQQKEEGPGGEAESRTKDERLTAMQGQLDELRKLKVLRLSRIGKEQEAYGLLDSGATNPMRGKRRGEDLSQLEEVQVTLADGSQVSRLDAMRMIQKLEEVETPRMQALKLSQEEMWLWELMEAHPVLKMLPEAIKRRLVVKPAEDLRGIPDANRRRRRVMAEQGFVVHLYAGESAGYSLSRAFKEAGGDGRRLVEIDVRRENHEKHKKGAHDMLDDENGPFASLLRSALDGSLLGIVMGPNCRSSSEAHDVRRQHHPEAAGGRPSRELRGVGSESSGDELSGAVKMAAGNDERSCHEDPTRCPSSEAEGVMSLDVTGPYKKGKDIDGEAKFMLIGTYTWLRPPDEEEATEVDEEPELEAQEDEDQWPEIEDQEAAQEEEEEQAEAAEDPQEEQQAEPPRAFEEPPEPPKIEVMRIGIPIKGKHKKQS
ncbi:unnamed protein product, partial [Cladocopium goreaui]